MTSLYHVYYLCIYISFNLKLRIIQTLRLSKYLQMIIKSAMGGLSGRGEGTHSSVISNASTCIPHYKKSKTAVTLVAHKVEIGPGYVTSIRQHETQISFGPAKSSGC